MLDVFRFAWFAVRTFIGFILLVFSIYAATWVLVKIHSMATRDVDPDAAPRLVNSYNARAIGKDQKDARRSAPAPKDCNQVATAQCAHD